MAYTSFVMSKFIILHSILVANVDCLNNNQVLEFNDPRHEFRLDVKPLRVFNGSDGADVMNALGCLAHCFNYYPVCKAVNFNEDKRICELLDVIAKKRYSNVLKGKCENGWTYYGIDPNKVVERFKGTDEV